MTETARSNPPGRPEVRYRIGDWATFRQRMLDGLPNAEVSGGARPLQALTTRDSSDPTIALVDASAVVLDVLTFYGERHLNEGTLATAQERMSLSMVARAIGYEPAPGLAASGYLAFETTALAEGSVEVPAGTAVMAMPEGSDPPPTFETTDPITARPEWNAIPIARRDPVPDVMHGDTEIWVDGVDNRAVAGDTILIYGVERNAQAGSERWEFRRLSTVEVHSDYGATRLVFDRPLGDPHTSPQPLALGVLLFRSRASLFGHNAPEWAAQSNQTQLNAWGRAGESFKGLPAREDPADDRTRLLRRSPPITEWPGFSLADDPAVATGSIDLDREYPEIVANSWVVLVDQYRVEAFQVERVSQRARVDFGLTAKVTRLKLVGEHLDRFDRRATTVFAAPDKLTHVGPPAGPVVTGATIRVQGDRRDLTGLLSVHGQVEGGDAVTGEVVAVTLGSFAPDGVTTLTVDPPLSGRYLRDGVKLNANLAPATHGGTAPEEIIASGNAGAPFQAAVLQGRPLTHVADADAPGGAASTLTVRVNGTAWREVPYLWGEAPDARVYRLRHASDGTTLVEFGDGITGARLPTGANNVAATYRTGIGLAGEAVAGRASLLTKRPEGIESAYNPTAFSGADDPEQAAAIRQNAPQTVLTLDRLVALQDYEDFARGFAGIGKALASTLSDGQRRLIHLTVASASGQPLSPTDPLRQSLAQAIALRKDPVHQVSIETFTQRTFSVVAALKLEPEFVAEEVYAAAHAALMATFSFQTRQFGQGVTPADVIAVLHTVQGVVAVDLDRISRMTPNASALQPIISAPPEVILPAAPPSTSGTVRQAAELLLMSADPDDLALRPMPS